MRNSIITKTRVIFGVACATLFGLGAGASVYILRKHSKEKSNEGFDVGVGPSIPDELVPEAREAGVYLIERYGKDSVSVVGVTEFADMRIYDVYYGASNYRVRICDDGLKELGSMFTSEGSAFIASNGYAGA